MAVVISPDDYHAVMDLIAQENLEAVQVAKVTDHPEMENWDKLTMTWKGKKIVDLHRSFLDQNGAQRHLDKVIVDLPRLGFTRSNIPEHIQELIDEGNFEQAFLENLKRVEVASQKGIGEIFDNSVGATNILAPYGGKTQSTPQI